jgi:transposase
MLFSHKLVLSVLAALGAFGLNAMEVKAASAPRTTAVFQDFDGTPCRIVTTTGRDRFVQCYALGVWTNRLALVRPSAESMATDDVRRVALAADDAAKDALRAMREVRPSVVVAFKNF